MSEKLYALTYDNILDVVSDVQAGATWQDVLLRVDSLPVVQAPEMPSESLIKVVENFLEKEQINYVSWMDEDNGMSCEEMVREIAVGITKEIIASGYREQSENGVLMACPKDLCEAVNNSDEFQWIVYDMGLMPEQITTKEQVCALRAAWMMYNALTALRSQMATPPQSVANDGGMREQSEGGVVRMGRDAAIDELVATLNAWDGAWKLKVSNKLFDSLVAMIQRLPDLPDNGSPYIDRGSQFLCRACGHEYWSRQPAGCPNCKPVIYSWPEDYHLENGNYECICTTCGIHFMGHKRRIICKVCATPSHGNVERKTEDKNQFNAFPMLVRLTRANIGKTIHEMATILNLDPVRVSHLEICHGDPPTEAEVMAYVKAFVTLSTPNIQSKEGK